MSDARMREMLAGVPIPEYASTPFAEPPPLERARVALVTTAGLARRAAPEPWKMGDAGFRVFAREERELFVAHQSANFDRAGISADLDVAYPIDRLEELAAEGRIGSLAPRHLSFMGALMDLSAIPLDSGPAAAKLLREDGVDVVLLTPV